MKALQNTYPAEADATPAANRKACQRLSDAMGAVARGEFLLALRYLEGYRRQIDYKAFFRRQADAPEGLSLSVIIAAFNTGRQLTECVASVLGGKADGCEIIVVDNGGNASVLHDLLALPVTYIKNPGNLYPSEARNIGAYFARAPLLAFLDDDALASPFFCGAAREALADPSVLAVRGRATAKTESPGVNAPPHYDLGPAPAPCRITLEGASAWRRKEYLDAGGMDPLLFGHEGEELSLRLQDRYPAARLLYWPDMLIRHDFAATEEAHESKRQRHAIMGRYFTWKRRQAQREATMPPAPCP